jgi:hypothetical protein
MKREYRKWFSAELGREMEMLAFGHDGLPAIVFPTSQGRFYEFEDRGLVAAVADKLERGQLQLLPRAGTTAAWDRIGRSRGIFSTRSTSLTKWCRWCAIAIIVRTWLRWDAALVDIMR